MVFTSAAGMTREDRFGGAFLQARARPVGYVLARGTAMGQMARTSAALAAVVVPLTIASCGARSELEAPGRPRAPALDPEVICAELHATAEPVIVDMFFLFDTSGSMSEVTAQGVSKWQALTDALWAFLFDPAAAGLRVGVAFFPEHDFTVPAFCAGGFGCGGSDDCKPLGNCFPSGTTICSTDEQCPGPNDQCQLSGYCPGGGGQCDPRVGGCMIGTCQGFGYCASHTRCDADAYHIGGVGTLPGDATGVGNAIASHTLDGFTPTLPAFQGLIDSALDWQTKNPDDVAIAVLATDGFPTLCDPGLQTGGVDQGVANIAAVAENGVAAGVKSYVLGVFAPQEAASAGSLLDTIAAAGGTSTAYVVGTDDDVAGRLIEALSEVRSENACAFLLPPGLEQLDLGRLRVAATFEDDSTVDLEQRPSADACAAGAGYYFDPPAPAVPQHILLCPATCELRPVSVLVTCAT
jgi:hypothetical protein